MHAADPARFPADFVWGAATSAYQVEGAVAEDGRGRSIWDSFCDGPGNVLSGDSGAVACDSYHRYGEDLALLRELGLGAFRFSVAWPRILPEGRGRVNTAGLDFYDRFVDGLLAAGIEPFVTLYHWDLPQALQDSGGWVARDTTSAFAELVEVVHARLGDRVQRWITICEPWVVSWLGYGTGEHAPGHRSEVEALAAVHNVLLAHAGALEVLRRDANARVGITVDLLCVEPASGAPADVAAARRLDGTRNRWILDPLLRGAYPEDIVEHFGAKLPRFEDGDLAAIAAPLDFLGVNYYTRNVVAAGPGGEAVVVEPERPCTAMGWEVYPDGLAQLLVRLRDDYDCPPIYVTENGAAYEDRVVDGRIDDPQRVAYLDAHFGALGEAIEAGVPVRGYFLWSLLDNFEWAWGYSRRFGIVHVDFDTLERTPKASFRWYQQLIGRHAAQRHAAGPRA
ncbi:MAG: GH1 family beta-glucosidase [Gaiellaceae bacterium]